MLYEHNNNKLVMWMKGGHASVMKSHADIIRSHVSKTAGSVSSNVTDEFMMIISTNRLRN